MESEHLNETRALPAKKRDELTELGWYLLQRDDTTLFPSPLIKFKWNACLLTACAVRHGGFYKIITIELLVYKRGKEKRKETMPWASSVRTSRHKWLTWSEQSQRHSTKDFSDIAQIQWINDRQPFSPPLDFKRPLWCHQKDKQTSPRWKVKCLLP